MRFSTLILLAFAGFAAAQTPIPPTETAPTGSVTVTNTASTSRTRTNSGTLSGTGTSSLSGTITASTNETATLTTSSATPTSTTYPSLGDASSCVVNCLQSSVSQANCSTIIDVNCYCTNDRFRSGLVQCVAANCPSDLSSAENYGQEFCNIVSVSLTYPPAPTSTTPASSSSPTATSGGSSNAASGSRREGGLWALAAVALGVAAL